MRLLVLIITVFFTGCTIEGSVISSQGLVQGWEHSGFRNIKSDIELVFYVENDDYLSLNETLVGIKTKDRKIDMEPAIGNKPFLIRVKVKSSKPDVYLKQNATLVLAAKEYHPIKVKKGIDRVLSGRETHDIKLLDYETFMSIDNTLEGIDHNWLWLEFDIETPHPSQSFSMYLELRDHGNVEALVVDFNAKEMNIYHH